jgi:hypothetical protein
MSPFIRIGWIMLVFWAASPIPASAQSADDFFNALGRVLRQIPDAGNQPPPPAQTARQPDRRVVPADPAPQYQAQQYQAPRYARADVLETPQRILNELGYDSGPVDGGYGGRTRRALIAFSAGRGAARQRKDIGSGSEPAEAIVRAGGWTGANRRRSAAGARGLHPDQVRAGNQRRRNHRRGPGRGYPVLFAGDPERPDRLD